MDSPATILTALTTIVAYGAMAAAIYYLIQIATELGEIKELLKQGKLGGSAVAKTEDSLNLGASLSLDSDSYAQNLLRKVKEQENEQASSAPKPAEIDVTDDPWRQPARADILARDPWAPDQHAAEKAAAGQLNAEPVTAEQTKPVTAAENLEPENIESGKTGSENVGKWTREMRRERRVTPRPTPPDASGQLTALGTSIAGSAARSSGSSASFLPSAPPSALTPTPLPAAVKPELSALDQQPGQELPLHTPSPLGDGISRVATPSTLSLENVSAPPALHPASPQVLHLALHPAADAKPRIWPPEPTGEDALPSFQAEAHKTIDWNVPLD